MNAQPETEMFPQTDLERLQTIRERLAEDADKAAGAVIKALSRADNAKLLLSQIDEVLDGFGGQNGGGPITGTGYGHTGAEITMDDSAIHPTGDSDFERAFKRVVADKAPAHWQPEVSDDGIMTIVVPAKVPDIPVSSPVAPNAATAAETRVSTPTEPESAENGATARQGVVYVYRVGSPTPVRTEVGDRTQYAELIADWLTEIGSADEITAHEVIGKDGNFRNLRAIIDPSDYGLQMVVR
ncbi:MAG: hypothetical protein ACLQUT_05350 [Thermoleophilia bacterium]